MGEGQTRNNLETWYLEGWGEVSWQRLATAAADATCAWADYTGFHIGSCPAAAPPYSHIWGWSRDGKTLFRGRIDNGRVTVGWLRMDETTGQSVDCVVRDMLLWSKDCKQVQARSYGFEQLGKAQTVEVLGSPVTFVRGWKERP